MTAATHIFTSKSTLSRKLQYLLGLATGAFTLDSM
jgi:hypothetical protein